MTNDSDRAALREWAARCAELTRDRLAEHDVWLAIAERGEEWELRQSKGRPYRGGERMEVKFCFGNSAQTVLGETAFNPRGCRYAEGFALNTLGMWLHHAWVVLPNGQAMDRTWDLPGQRYVGVIVDPLLKEAGESQLADWAVGDAWAPHYVDDPDRKLDLLFGAREVAT